MAVIVFDTFTAGADENLDAHTPDTGNTWVQVAITGTTRIIVVAATDVVSASANANSNGEYCKSQPAPTSVDVDVSLTLIAADTGAANARKCRVHARGSGTTDYYAVRFSPTGAAVNDVELVKVVGGTLTSLGSVDTALAANDVFTLEIRDATKRVLKNGAEILSSTDNAITAAGDCGFSMGQVSAGDTGNIAGTWDWDTYEVDEIVAPPAPTTTGYMTTMRGIWGA